MQNQWDLANWHIPPPPPPQSMPLLGMQVSLLMMNQRVTAHKHQTTPSSSEKLHHSNTEGSTVGGRWGKQVYRQGIWFNPHIWWAHSAMGPILSCNASSTKATLSYQDYLIIAPGANSRRDWICNVNILDTTCDKWKTAQSLPNRDDYFIVSIEDTLYLVGRANKTACATSTYTLHRIYSRVWYVGNSSKVPHY